MIKNLVTIYREIIMKKFLSMSFIIRSAFIAIAVIHLKYAA